MVNDNVLNNFLSYLNLQKRFSALTVQSYATDLSQFFAFLDDEVKNCGLADITYQHIRSFMASLLDNGMSANSANRKLSALKSFFKYLVATGTLTQNPAQKIMRVKAPKRLPVFIDESQMGKIFSTITFGSDFEGIRNKLIIDILYQTGVRRAELLSLKEADVDIYNSQLKVLGKRNKERIIPFAAGLKRNLEYYLRVKGETGLSGPCLLVSIKNKPMSPAQITKVVNDILGQVSTSSKKSPHVLRHTFATHMLNSGANINAVKELLGHASLAATQVYTHNTIDKLKKLYNQAHPRSGH